MPKPEMDKGCGRGRGRPRVADKRGRRGPNVEAMIMDADSVSPAMNKLDAQQVTDLLRPVSTAVTPPPRHERSPWGPQS